MSTTGKLVTDLTVILRGMRSHEGLVGAHRAQANSDAVDRHLREVEAREQVVADRVARALRGLGAPAPRALPSWLPSPVSIAADVATQTQPLGEALVVEATTVRMLADRARVAHGLAVAIEQRETADVTTQVADVYDAYADWLVQTAAAVTVNPNTADLVATTVQRVAGQVKGVVGAPARFYGQAADRTAEGLGRVTDRVRHLVGLGGEKLDDAVDSATDAVVDTARSVQDAVTPVDASDLPVTRYDDRTAAEAAKAVRRLDTVDDVSTVLAYESRHKDRKTVLEAGDRRVAELADASR